jgi:hypothetical protein
MPRRKMMNNINIHTIEVAGLYPAIYSMRNAMSSWDKSDSKKCETKIGIAIGEDDLKLAQKLTKAGSEHCKYLRMVQVWADFKMPRYWWSEFDTYHFNTKNSTSTMHTIFKEHIQYKHLYLEDMPTKDVGVIGRVLDQINRKITEYNETKNYDLVIEIKRMLPESFIQMRTVNTNYAELMSAYHQRKNHRLKKEWGTFCEWCLTLPYFKELCVDPLTNK